jgi:hypothetical protein
MAAGSPGFVWESTERALYSLRMSTDCIAFAMVRSE